jgi:hypothetical protein
MQPIWTNCDQLLRHRGLHVSSTALRLTPHASQFVDDVDGQTIYTVMIYFYNKLAARRFGHAFKFRTWSLGITACGSGKSFLDGRRRDVAFCDVFSKPTRSFISDPIERLGFQSPRFVTSRMHGSSFIQTCL